MVIHVIDASIRVSYGCLVEGNESLSVHESRLHVVANTDTVSRIVRGLHSLLRTFQAVQLRSFEHPVHCDKTGVTARLHAIEVQFM